MSTYANDLPELLRVTDNGDGRYQAFQPSESAEGRDVIFSGQYLAQMLMASEAAAGAQKAPRSIHAVFARAGTYTKPLDLVVEAVQAGRTWGSDTVTAVQDGRVLARAIVLLNTTDDDLIRHEPAAPAGVPGPDEVAPAAVIGFPGAELRPVPGQPERDGVPVQMAWHRYPQKLSSAAANQGVLVWSTCSEIIGLAMRPHADKVDISQAHRTISTGVIAHTAHFLEPVDASEWLLIVTEATKAAGGRVYGGGSVFDAAGRLVATFHQDSMARAATAPLDAARSM